MSQESEASGNESCQDEKKIQNLDQKVLKEASLKIDKKMVYIDLKENSSGIFIKIAEVSKNKQRSHITLPITIAFNFQKKLQRAYEISQETLGDIHDRDKLFSDVIVKENRKYYIDLKENSLGRFLRVAMVNRDFRTQISIPSKGLKLLIDIYQDIISDYSSNQIKINQNLPESQSMRSDSKTFYFDFGTNQYGSFVRISEVRKLSRTAITIPDVKLEEFCQIMLKCKEEMSLAKSKIEANIKDEKVEENNNQKEPEAGIEPNINLLI